MAITVLDSKYVETNIDAAECRSILLEIDKDQDISEPSTVISIISLADTAISGVLGVTAMGIALKEDEYSDYLENLEDFYTHDVQFSFTYGDDNDLVKIKQKYHKIRITRANDTPFEGWLPAELPTAIAVHSDGGWTII